MTQEENGGLGQSPQLGRARAVLYLRVAHAQQGGSQAVAHQRAACLRFAESYGLSIVREYVDLGKPARYSYQSALQHLLSDLDEKRDAAYVVTYDHSRVSRMLQELTSIMRRVHGCGAVISTANNNERHNEGGTTYEC